jgi:hypothetical protein
MSGPYPYVKLMYTLIRCLRASFDAVRQKSPRDRFYGYSVVLHDAPWRMYPRLMSEERLARRTKGSEAEERRLRWDPGSWMETRYGLFAPVHDLLAISPEEEDLEPGVWRKHSRMMFDAAAAGLEGLDVQGYFGRGAERRGVILFVSALDHWEKQVLEYARALNPKGAFDLFRREYPNWQGKKKSAWPLVSPARPSRPTGTPRAKTGARGTSRAAARRR